MARGAVFAWPRIEVSKKYLKNKIPRHRPGVQSSGLLTRIVTKLGDFQIFRGALAAIFHKVIFDDLIFVEG